MHGAAPSLTARPRRAWLASFLVTRVLLLRVLPVIGVAVLVAVATVLAGGGPGAAAGSERLPDLDQAAPSNLSITRAGSATEPVFRLGFRSAVANVGDGPLAIEARRPSRDTATMVADQVVERDGAPREVVPDVGRLRFVVSSDHRHWHLLAFDRYELRRAGGGAPLVRDRKTGFCLGDRYAVRGARLPATSPRPAYTSRCGLGAPGRLAMREGISVGYGDDYPAHLEGQYLPLNGVRPGRYLLVHRVNPGRRLRERSYRNNAASLLLELRRQGGEPAVRVLATCPGTARCEDGS
jgi:Lysyl oxidase